MKAAIVAAVGSGFEIAETEISDPIGAEVLVHVRASGLCHSDLTFSSADFGLPMPAVFGHEVAGVVAAIGPEVRELRIGDHVVACLVQSCGHCVTCRAGRFIDCPHAARLSRADGEPPRLSVEGRPAFQVAGIGGFAEQALIHENQLAKVNREIGFAQAALLGCAVVTGAGAVVNAARVTPGSSVAVIGTGGVGMNVISGAALSGAAKIIAVDLAEEKIQHARRFGATHTVNAGSTDAVEAVHELTEGGADYVFEVVGLPATQSQAVACTRPGGTAVLLGMAKPGSVLELDTSFSHLQHHRTIMSVSMGATDLKRDIPLFADLYIGGRFNLDDLVSRTIALSEIDQAYRDLESGTIIRSVVTSF